MERKIKQPTDEKGNRLFEENLTKDERDDFLKQERLNDKKAKH